MAKPDAGPWYTVARVVAVLAIVGVAGGVYAWYKAFRVVPQEICGDVEPSRRAELCADDAEERFKYGSLGAEADLGIPYPIFHVLPRVFGDLMPGPGGYRAFGIPWEEGRELPVGFSKKTMGFPRITQTCAICHAASYRTCARRDAGHRALRPLAHDRTPWPSSTSSRPPPTTRAGPATA